MTHLDFKTNTLGELTDLQKRGFNFLTQESADARNNYYEAVLKFEEKDIRRILADALDPNGRTPNYYAKTYQNKLDKLGLWKLQWLQEAQRYFDGKLLTMVDKLVEFGMLNEGMMLDKRDIEIDGGLGLEFYISAFDTKTSKRYGRAHARFVWVNCYEKVSHYRFIVTFKKDPNYNTEETQEVVDTVEVKKGKESRLDQVRVLWGQGMTSKQIANELGSNQSYIQKLIRDLRK